MKKITILIGIFIFVLVIFIVFLLLNRPVKPENIVSPTPSPVADNSLLLMSTDPINNTKNVKTNQEIIFTFNNPVNESNITILVSPETKLSVAYRGKTVVIRPETAWAEGISYRISIQYADRSRIPDGINFVVEGTPPATLPDTGPNQEQIKQSEELQRNESPDVFLSNYTPYETDLFTMSSEYASSPVGHFYFTVIKKQGGSENIIRTQVKEWILSLGLTEIQYNNLDVRYK
jgi:hypothetical protein